MVNITSSFPPDICTSKTFIKGILRSTIIGDTFWRSSGFCKRTGNERQKLPQIFLSRCSRLTIRNS